MSRRYAALNEQNQVLEIFQNASDISPSENRTLVKVMNGLACHVGWVFDGVIFRPPRWTSYQFFLRMTSAEREGIRQLSLTDSNIADFLMLAQLAQEIDSSDPLTQAGMNYMVLIGFLQSKERMRY